MTAFYAFVLAWLSHWTRNGGNTIIGRSRKAVFLGGLVGLTLLSYTYLRRQWLYYLQQQTLSEISSFVTTTQKFDHVAASAMSLVQEVELVSRGYRM